MKILVAYASKRGSTAEIAEAVAEAIARTGHDVDCRPAAEVRALGRYDAVILGSAVYMKRWRPEARRFLRHHATELAARPFWIFSSGPVGDPIQTAEPAWLEPAKVVAQAARLGARGHVVFGGRLPAEPHTFVERAMVRNTPPQYRDRRDWDEIRDWAEGVAAQLGSVAAAAVL